ncbi:MAG: NADH-quinone oxidoreductase subunit H [Acidobacteriota bacterium]|nr:NADH-quinone oxidoreductase subunit H [Acidobacteriota bacterium]
MGVVAAALWSVGALAAGAAATVWLERRAGSGAPEPGPALALDLRHEPRLTARDAWLYAAAPFVAILGVCFAIVTIPFGPSLLGRDLQIGLFYLLVVVDFVVLGVALGGWGANTPDSVEACYRIVAQLVAYVVPLGLAVIGPAMMARSLSLQSIVEAQSRSGHWYVVSQPLGFLLYLTTALMQSYRSPFCAPFAREIGGGVLAAYGAWKAVCWRIALSGLLFVVAAAGAVLFLGGGQGPFLPGPVWMLLKTFALLFFMVWAGARLRPASTAETLALGWKVLIPAGLVNVLVVGALILLGVGQTPFAGAPR